MNKDEIFEALLKGAIVHVTDSGEAKLATMDDLPPRVRECFRASRPAQSAYPDMPRLPRE